MSLCRFSFVVCRLLFLVCCAGGFRAWSAVWLWSLAVGSGWERWGTLILASPLFCTFAVFALSFLTSLHSMTENDEWLRAHEDSVPEQHVCEERNGQERYQCCCSLCCTPRRTFLHKIWETLEKRNLQLVALLSFFRSHSLVVIAVLRRSQVISHYGVTISPPLSAPYLNMQ